MKDRRGNGHIALLFL